MLRQHMLLSPSVAHLACLTKQALLQAFQRKRFIRASTIHGLAGSAAIMASTYKAHLGEGMGPLQPHITKYKIPHPGRVGGYFAMNLTMPTVLAWVLGGNVSNLEGARSAFCRMADQPKGFNEKDFRRFLKDDDALIRASKASWLLQPLTATLHVNAGKTSSLCPCCFSQRPSLARALCCTSK